MRSGFRGRTCQAGTGLASELENVDESWWERKDVSAACLCVEGWGMRHTLYTRLVFHCGLDETESGEPH